MWMIMSSWPPTQLAAAPLQELVQGDPVAWPVIIGRSTSWVAASTSVGVFPAAAWSVLRALSIWRVPPWHGEDAVGDTERVLGRDADDGRGDLAGVPQVLDGAKPGQAAEAVAPRDPIGPETGC